MTPEDLFAGRPLALAVFERVRELLEPVEVRVTASQVALWHRHGFAYVWAPGRYLAHPGAEVVLSIALEHELVSPRFKQVVHPAPKHWMHHLEVQDLADLDDEVAGWLREAAREAAL